jgi:hypothetical protein
MENIKQKYQLFLFVLTYFYKTIQKDCCWKRDLEELFDRRMVSLIESVKEWK